MKKRNIVRFTALLMAVLICLSTGLTLFAEGVDSTEATTEAEPQTVSGNDTEAKTVSDNDATTSTRSELGKKILDFKNPDEYNNQYIFDVLGRIETYDDVNDIYRYGDVSTDLQNETTGWFGATGAVDGKYAIYFEDSDSFKYIKSHDDSIEPYTDSILSDSDITKDKCISAFRLSILPNDLTDFSFKDYIKDAYICIFDKDSNDIKFVCPYEDFIKYSRETTSTYDNSSYTITVEPIKDSDGFVNRVKCTVNYKIDIVLGAYTNKELKEGLKTFCILDSDGYSWNKSNISGDYSKNTGTFSFELTVKKGTYKFQPIYNTDFWSNKTVDFMVDYTENNPSEDTKVPDENLEAATVSFSGMPNEAYTNDSVTLKMNTDKKCKMSFNGSSLANDEYTTSADFTVSRNGTYSYTATNEQGIATNGTFEVTFFKDKVDDAIEDPLQADLISAKTDSNLSQTGLYQTWLIILAVILCSFGILLIVNQKYHFLDKFIRRFKHESN